MGRLLRVLGRVAAVLVVAGLVFHSWVGAQWRAAVVLATVMDPPVAGSVVRHLTREPVTEDPVRTGSADALVMHPPGSGPWPAVFFLTGADARGRHHPEVKRLARGLARAGYIAIVPDVPGLTDFTITDRTVQATIDAIDAAARLPGVRRDRVALMSVSAGASLTMLAAADESLRGSVSAIGGIAPYASMREALRLATTGTYRMPSGRIVSFEPRGPTLERAISRSLAEMVADHPDWAAPVARLQATDDPSRFDDRYDSLPLALRRQLDALSPVRSADDLAMPVELVSEPRDKYFPVAESRSIVRRAPHARLVVTSSLAHAIPTARDFGGLVALDGFAVRILRNASR